MKETKEVKEYKKKQKKKWEEAFTFAAAFLVAFILLASGVGTILLLGAFWGLAYTEGISLTDKGALAVMAILISGFWTLAGFFEIMTKAGKKK